MVNWWYPWRVGGVILLIWKFIFLGAKSRTALRWLTDWLKGLKLNISLYWEQYKQYFQSFQSKEGNEAVKTSVKDTEKNVSERKEQ